MPSDEIEHRNVGRHGDRRLRQRYLEDDGERDEEEDQQPEIGNGDDQAAGDGGDEALHDPALAYFVSTTPASGRNETQARSFQLSGSSVRRWLLTRLVRTMRPSSS